MRTGCWKIGKFCAWDDDGTLPGTKGAAGTRALADRRWKTIQETRRHMAEALAILNQ